MLSFFGHFHPLLVHLPIGILLFVCLTTFLPKDKRDQLGLAVRIALILSALSAVFACLTGYQLSLNGEYDEAIVSKHLWLGISTATLSILCLLFKAYQRPLIWITSVILSMTGHYGGVLTHGEDYLFAKENNEEIDSAVASINNKDTTVHIDSSATTEHYIFPYQDEVKPILQQKCYSCHSSLKKKGGLRLDSEAFIVKGGKNGKIIQPNLPQKSTLYTHLLLPEDDDLHMPPKGKKQLSQREINIIHHWIAGGAVFTKIVMPGKKAASIIQTEPIHETIIEEKEQPQVMVNIKPVDPSGLQKTGVIVTQDSRGVSLNFVNIKTITPEMLAEIKNIRTSIYEIKMSGQAFSTTTWEAIPSLPNLKKLNLSQSNVEDNHVASFKNFPALEQLFLYETNISDESINDIKDLTSLKDLYIWKTKMTDKGINRLMKSHPKLHIESGSFQLRKPDSTKTN